VRHGKSGWLYGGAFLGKGSMRGKVSGNFLAASRDSQSAGWLDKRLTHKSDVGFN